MAETNLNNTSLRSNSRGRNADSRAVVPGIQPRLTAGDELRNLSFVTNRRGHLGRPITNNYHQRRSPGGNLNRYERSPDMSNADSEAVAATSHEQAQNEQNTHPNMRNPYQRRPPEGRFFINRGGRRAGAGNIYRGRAESRSIESQYAHEQAQNERDAQIQPNTRSPYQRHLSFFNSRGQFLNRDNFRQVESPSDESKAPNQNPREQAQNEQNAFNTNQNSSNSDNSGNQGPASSGKCNNNTAELPNLNHEHSSSDGCDQCRWQLAPHLHFPAPIQIASRNNQQQPAFRRGQARSDAAWGSRFKHTTPNLGNAQDGVIPKASSVVKGENSYDLPRNVAHSSRNSDGVDSGNSSQVNDALCDNAEARFNFSKTSQSLTNASGLGRTATNAGRGSLRRPYKDPRFNSEHQDLACSVARPVVKRNTNVTHDTVRKKNDPSHTTTSGALGEEWVNAPEFYPKNTKPKSYAEAATPPTMISNTSKEESVIVCPNFESTGFCRVGDACPYAHGDICDLCNEPVLHPVNEEQRKTHNQQCLERHERDMELSFAVARSREKTCGICFETVMEKEPYERRFGILPKCNHCFCLGCIRRWRQARQFENKVVRACPECRVTSDFVCPSPYWVDTKEEKDKLIDNYKNALAEKECKYFKQGRGRCPFGNKCFYLHALPDGTKTDVGPPPRRPRNNRNRHHHDEGELGDMLQQIILWDFLDEHDHHWLYSFADDLEDMVAFFSDSDESEWSEYDYLLE